MTDKEAWRHGIDEAIKRIESFKSRVVLGMRLKTVISDEQYEFTCKLVDAQLKLLNGKGN